MKPALILLASIATLVLAKKFETRPSGLKVKYISVPETCDVKVMSGQVVLVHYTGKLKDGTKFQSEENYSKLVKEHTPKGLSRGWKKVFWACALVKRGN
jgi:FKBP-type peptidyl-prolyl cis-trans isomerase